MAAGLWARLRSDDRAFLNQLAELTPAGARLALVGGAVRDAFLGRQPLDVDVVLEGGDVLALAKALQQQQGVPFVFHAAYQNATLTLPGGRALDLVCARSEHYPVAGAAPVVRPASLADDLARRDFGCNAVALLLPERQLYDPLQGVADLQQKLLRPLSAHSFTDDASRLVRAARLAARLGFIVGPDLLAQVPLALAVAEQTPRLWAELGLLLHEPRPLLALELLHAWGAPLMPVPAPWLGLQALQEAGHEVGPATYAAALLHVVAAPELWMQRLSLGERQWRLLQRALSERAYAPASAEWQLRRLLRPQSYVGLSGREVMALGVPEGPQVGRVLGCLQVLRGRGEVASREDEVRVVLAKLV